MVGESRNLEEGFLEEESLVFLYGEELRSFLNDDFEGSNQEGHIFTEVFYGKNAYGTAKGFRKVGMANYASDKNMQSMAVASFNSESPVPTFQPSLKGLYGRDHKGRFKETKVDGSGSSRLHKHSCGQLELGVCNLKSKHGTTSSEGPPNSQRKERGCCLSDFGNEFLFLNSSKYDPKSNMVDLNDIPQPTPYRIVESFSQGIISSCFFPSYCDGGDNPNYSDYDTPSRSNDSNDIIRDMKVDGEGKFTTPLLPGESSASKLRVGNGPNALTMNGECKIFDTDVAGSSMAFVRELPHRLRLHAQNFLLDAGWKIEGRRRKDRCKHYSIFRTPGEGVAISSLIKAWRICGECLVAGESSPSLEENGRQWLEIDGFWCDLADALAYIEREVQHLHSSMSLLHRWRLLDPFVSVVCIDKKISALREGKTVKFVKGRIVDLGSSRYLSLTEKSGPSSRKPAKFPSHSVSRSSHCLHPCKSSSSSTPVSSSMNDAVVEESILSVVKPEVTKTSHNKKLGCKNIPEVHRQVNHYPKEKEKNGSGGLRRKLSFDGEVRSVKNPAKSIGYGSNFDRRVPKKKHPGFLECSKQESTPMGAPSLIRKGLTLSSTASEPNVPLSLSPQISQSDLSEQDLKSTGAASTGIGASDSCKGFRVESQPHEEAASCQQTENLYPKGDTASYGRKKKCGKVTKVVPVFHGSNNAVILCLASNAKVAGKSHSAQKEKDKEGLNGKRLESANAQMSDQFAEVQMVQFLHTQQAVSGDLMNVASEAAVYQDACSSVVRPKHLKKKPANSTEASESGLEHSSAEVPGNKKASKRSRKISDIAATKLLHKNMKHTPPSEKYEGQIVLELDDKLSNNLDFPLLQEVDNILKVGTVPSNLITSENHKVPDGNAIEMLGTVEMSSAVTEVSMAQEKTHETPRARFVKVNRTSKKRKQQVVKPESASINLDTDPDTGECKNDCNKCQMENGISSEAASTSPLQHAKTKKYPTIGSKSKMSVASCQHLLRPQNENFTIEASIPSEGKSPQSQINQRTAKRNICESQKGNCQKRQRKDDIDDDDLLIAVIIKNRDQNSNGTHSSSNAKKPQSKGCRNLKSRKGSCKLLLRTSGKCGVPPISGARTPLGWLLNSGVVPLNAAIQCRSPKNNSILKDGRVAREGILCRCCSKIFSVSAFKCHAGCKLKQTSLNLFLESGKSYTLCQLQAWSDEYKARKDGRQVTEVEEVDQNDDTCGLCGDGGELICCDNCPSTFHQACLHSQVIPEGSWYCPNCTCKICGDAVAAKMPLGSFIMLECSQCERKYHDICLTKMGSSNDRSVSDIWFCGEHCEKGSSGAESLLLATPFIPMMAAVGSVTIRSNEPLIGWQLPLTGSAFKDGPPAPRPKDGSVGSRLGFGRVRNRNRFGFRRFREV
ncbi:hypothetical protein Taro_003512 [Colocasia esculenta]|uniref:PHD-type domain-containing protein n=1 Tax=Colocasia esculenta TaxID=4460 RepID=A0A843TMA2_COLES|nr:hypothetical protein [Colocasia esculenta]